MARTRDETLRSVLHQLAGGLHHAMNQRQVTVGWLAARSGVPKGRIKRLLAARRGGGESTTRDVSALLVALDMKLDISVEPLPAPPTQQS